MSYLEIYFTGSSRNGFCSLKQKLNKKMDSRRERGLGTFYESPTAFTNPSLCFFYYEESSFPIVELPNAERVAIHTNSLYADCGWRPGSILPC